MSSRPRLPDEFIQVGKRKRIMEACVELCAEKGLKATKIADMVGRAGVARKTLYDNYAGKQEVFEAAMQDGIRRLIDRIREAAAVGESVEDKVRMAVGNAALWADQNPALTKTFLLETPAAAPRIREDLTVALAAMTGLPQPVDEMTVGGALHIFYQCAVQDQPYSEVQEELAEFVLAAFRPVLV